MGLALNQGEKKIIPALGLHCSAQTLNQHIIRTHRDINRKEKEFIKTEIESKIRKNKNLLDGLGITTKPKRAEVEHKVIETRGATLLNAKRVINFTEVGQSYTKSDLARDLIIQTTVVEEIMMFLNKYTNIKFNEVGGRYVRES